MRVILAALLAVSFSLPLVADEKKFFESIKAKAVGGDAAAQHSLGFMYANGRGVSIHEAKAVLCSGH